MPGTPSFTGCDACHRQKKKCDLVKPACSRCVRRNIPCVGTGKRRFRFKDESSALMFKENRMVAAGSAGMTWEFMVDCPFFVPSNRQTTATRQLVSILDVTNPGFDVYCYGPIMGDLPQRMGNHRALDAAIAAFNSTTNCAPTNQMTVKAQRNYGIALSALQKCLQDPKTAYTADTLAAIHLIIVCNGWMQQRGDKSPNHGEGILHLMNHLVTNNSGDEFLLKSIVTATGALIRESIFDPTIDVQPWIRRLSALSKRHNSPIATAALNKFTAAGFPLKSSRYETLATLPILIRNPGNYIEQVEDLYDAFRQEYAELKAYEEEKFPADKNDPESPVTFLTYIRAKTIFQEAQCLVLALCIVFNALLSDSRPNDAVLEKERVEFCADAVIAAEESKIGRPFGALQVPIVVISAWLSSRDEAQKEKLLALLEEYQGTFAMHHFLRQASKWKDAPKRLMALPWFPIRNEVVAEVARDTVVEEKNRKTKHTPPEGDNCEKCCIL